MIGRLRGIIEHIGKDHVILDVNGVGYLVYTATSTLQSLGIGEELESQMERAIN